MCWWCRVDLSVFVKWFWIVFGVWVGWGWMINFGWGLMLLFGFICKLVVLCLWFGWLVWLIVSLRFMVRCSVSLMKLRIVWCWLLVLCRCWL